MRVRFPPMPPSMPKLRLVRKDFKWNRNLAYAVGLLTTDGNLSSDKRHIVFVSTDTDLIKTFRKCLNKNNKISKHPLSRSSKKQAYRLQIGDVVLYDWLRKIGLTPKKSLSIGKIKIQNKYFPDFLRGHLDGDGSIIYYKDRYNTKLNPKYIYNRLFVYFLSASSKHIEWLRSKIFELIKIKGSVSRKITKTQKGTNSMTRLKFSTKETKVLLNWIYYRPNLPCLLRKYEIAKPFLTNL